MTLSFKIATVDDLKALDFKSPFDELTELRAVLTTTEIAEFTGLRRETISRARADRGLRPRTEKAIGDLYLVTTRMRAVLGGDAAHLAAVLRRPQDAFGGRSIGDLLRGGRVEQVLAHLAAPAGSGAPDPDEAAAVQAKRVAYREREEKRVAAFLAADPEMAALLPEIEARVRHHFAPVKEIERGVAVDYEGDGEDILYVWARTELSSVEQEERFLAFLEAERDFLRPVRTRLNIGVR